MDWGARIQVPLSAGIFDVRVDGPQEGDPIVLLHGFPQTSVCWGPVAAQLVSAGWRVVAPDQRGYSPGARPDGVAHYQGTLLADDVAELADALGVERFHLVGHDWGASVAWVVADRHAEKVLSLTAVSVPHPAAYLAAVRDDPDQRHRAAYIDLFRQPGKAEEVLLAEGARRLRAMYQGIPATEVVEEYIRQLTEPGALTAALSWYRAMGRGAPRPTTVPTTYVWSDADRALGRAGAEACGAHVRADYRFEVLPGVSHWVPEEAPVPLARAILDRVGGTAAR